MHYAFDAWMTKEFPGVGFERYVDDAVVHCKSERQAQMLVQAIGRRMRQVGLSLHPGKTKIVYRPEGRKGQWPVWARGFYLPRIHVPSPGAKDRNGKIFTSFLPAISKDALKAVSAEVRGWAPAHARSTSTRWTRVAPWINPIVRGWMNYYGRFYRSALYPLLKRINAYLVRWARKEVQNG